MKEVKAYIRPEMISNVYKGLDVAGHCCITVTEGEGTGKYSDPKSEHPTLKHPFTHSEVVKLEIVCEPDDVDEIVGIIHEKGTTGYPGDGIITVTDLDKVYSVKNGVSGAEAV